MRNRYQSAAWRELTSASQPPWSRRGHRALVSAVVALTRRLDQREPFSAFHGQVRMAGLFGLWSQHHVRVHSNGSASLSAVSILRHSLLRIDMVALENRHVDLQSKLVQRPGNNARLADRSAISALRSAHGSLQPVLHFATSTPLLEVLLCLRPSVYKRLGHLFLCVNSGLRCRSSASRHHGFLVMSVSAPCIIWDSRLRFRRSFLRSYLSSNGRETTCCRLVPEITAILSVHLS